MENVMVSNSRTLISVEFGSVVDGPQLLMEAHLFPQRLAVGISLMTSQMLFYSFIYFGSLLNSLMWWSRSRHCLR